MTNKILLPIVIGCLTLLLTSCGGKQQAKTDKSSDEKTEGTVAQASEGIASELLGNYHGIQASYNLKNQYGDDMIINGNKIVVPSSDFKFLLKDNQVVSLQQTNLEDNSRVYYEGTYKILSETADNIKLECTLSDGQTSNPTYTLSINKKGNTGICNGSKEPSFPIERQ